LGDRQIDAFARNCLPILQPNIYRQITRTTKLSRRLWLRHLGFAISINEAWTYMCLVWCDNLE